MKCSSSTRPYATRSPWPGYGTCPPKEAAGHWRPSSAAPGGAVLELTRDGTTTGDLAHRLGVAPATASGHLGVLRSAGLITSRREGQRVWHTITPLGTSLATGTAHGTE
ncbi:metalloregulator ArsR/SmtB family transcription factor [Streptomyces sp. NPDC047028]|uniref:ArsR/SmtB family transcription factor n=1 Tax=Streptomyces sp. NPDC047028 TaxID=3155793 RepID=UPI0034101F8E